MSKINVFFANGYEEIEGLTVIDLLRRAGLEVDIVSINNVLEVKGAHDIVIKADKLLKDVDFENGDMIVLPGGLPGTTYLGECEELTKQIVKYNNEKKMLAAICAAPSVFGQLGILEGKSATCYPGFEDILVGAVCLNSGVVKSSNVITANGMGTAIEFALTIIEHYLGKGKAVAIAKAIQYKYYE
ncbi:MAG: DJ-1/PfpI family protein [Clostridia bacterium]|nr:DJ-1/PfpI family protein [Clostridia bacterium]